MNREGLSDEQFKQYWEEYIQLVRTLDTEPAPSFDTFLKDRGLLNKAVQFCKDTHGIPLHAVDLEGVDELTYSEEALDGLQELAGKTIFDHEPTVRTEKKTLQKEKPKGTVEQVEKLTLRDNKGRLIGHYDMTRGEFIKLMKPMFDHFVLDSKDANTYKAW
jgi:hypothetical protein